MPVASMVQKKEEKRLSKMRKQSVGLMGQPTMSGTHKSLENRREKNHAYFLEK